MASFTRPIQPPSANKVRTINRRMQQLRTNPNTPGGLGGGDYFNFSIMNDVLYKGRSDRISRYNIYDIMDGDTDIARSLDIIAEHCTQKDQITRLPMSLRIENSDIGDTATNILNDLFGSWCKLNDLDNRLWRTIRSTVKYGDSFFIRDVDYVLYPIHPRNCIGAYVNIEGKVEAYAFVRLNRRFPFMLNVNTEILADTRPSQTYGSMGSSANFSSQSRGQTTTFSGIIPVEHVRHLSLNEGRQIGGNGQDFDIWPFGESYLEQIHKDYKARSLLEEAELINRIQRAPSRRAFYVNVGKMRGDRVDAYMRKFRNSITQKIIPTKDGGGASMDSVYNPISQMEDIYLPVTDDGKGTKVENIDGVPWDDNGSLKYWQSKLMRGLRVPTSFMLGPEEGGAQYNDGRVGTAYMQEFQFSQFCERVQDLLDNEFDQEFKMYLKWRGINVIASAFELKFTPPMNFGEYREFELNGQRLQQLGTALGYKEISKRFAFLKYGGFSDSEILENERMWREENQESKSREASQNQELGGMGAGSLGSLGAFQPANALPDQSGFDPSMDQSMDMTGAAGGMDMGMGGGMNAPGGGLGTTPGGIGGGTAPPTGFESYMKKLTRTVITETDDIDDIDVQTREDEYDNSNKPTPDGQFNVGKNGNKKPLYNLSHVRKMRLEREQSRQKLLIRLAQLPLQYGQPSGGGGMF